MIQRMLQLGVRELFGGARRGQPVVTGLSAAVALIAYLRKNRRPKKEMLYGVNLGEGQSIRISFLKGDARDEADESGA